MCYLTKDTSLKFLMMSARGDEGIEIQSFLLGL